MGGIDGSGVGVGGPLMPFLFPGPGIGLHGPASDTSVVRKLSVFLKEKAAEQH